MKKIVLVFISLLLFSACSMTNSPKSQVESYLGKYNSLHEDVVADMETKVSAEDLSDDNRKLYKEILTREYQDLKYTVKDEKIDGDTATVTAKITVYDLYKSQNNALIYLSEHTQDYYEGEVFDENRYVKYRLDEMLKTKDTVDYEVTFYLNKKDDKWELQNPDRQTLEKINGLYNYES